MVRGALFYRTLLIWPYAVAPAVAGVVWLFMFSPSIGVIAYWLRSAGFEWNPLLNGNDAMALIVMAAVWKQISYNFLFFVAGLQSIPHSLIEAAAIDGAGAWRRFWTIQFPLLSPTTFFLLVINVVYAFFDTFGIVDAATTGGPGKDTAILVYKVYFDGFKALDLGGSAAQSVVLMVDRDRAHRDPVPVRREEGELLMVERNRFLTRAVAPDPDRRRADRRLPGVPDLRRVDAHHAGSGAGADAAAAGQQHRGQLRAPRCSASGSGGGSHAPVAPHDDRQPGHGPGRSPSARSPSRCCPPSRSSISASRSAWPSSGPSSSR